MIMVLEKHFSHLLTKKWLFYSNESESFKFGDSKKISNTI